MKKYNSFITSKKLEDAVQRGLQLRSLGVRLPEVAKILSMEFPELERGPEGRRVMMKVKYAEDDSTSPFDSSDITHISRELVKIAHELIVH